MNIDIKFLTSEEHLAIEKKYEGQKPTDILRELISYSFSYQRINNFKTAEMSQRTINNLEEILFWWEKENASLLHMQKWSDGKKFKGYKEGENPYKEKVLI